MGWTFGIFLLAFLSFLLVGFKALLKPIEKQLDQQEEGLKSLHEQVKEELAAVHAGIDKNFIAVVSLIKEMRDKDNENSGN